MFIFGFIVGIILGIFSTMLWAAVAALGEYDSNE